MNSGLNKKGGHGPVRPRTLSASSLILALADLAVSLLPKLEPISLTLLAVQACSCSMTRFACKLSADCFLGAGGSVQAFTVSSATFFKAAGAGAFA